MGHRFSNYLSSVGVGTAIFGVVAQQHIVSFLSLLLTVAVHFWNSKSKPGADKTVAELEYWKGRAYALDGRCDQLAAEVKELKANSLPVAVVPPFIAAGAVVDSDQWRIATN